MLSKRNVRPILSFVTVRKSFLKNEWEARPLNGAESEMPIRRCGASLRFLVKNGSIQTEPLAVIGKGAD